MNPALPKIRRYGVERKSGVNPLAVIETHPIQYHAPVYRAVQQEFSIPVTIIYGSDFSIVGYYDKEFDATFAWDTDLLSGYSSVFLSRASKEEEGSIEKLSTPGIGRVLKSLNPGAVMILGYSPRFHQLAFYEAWRRGYPIIFRGETTDHLKERNPVKTVIRDSLLRFIYKRCAKLLYIGQNSYRHFKRLGAGDEQLIFSPYCVDTSSFQCDETTRSRLKLSTRQELDIREEDIAILFSGKLSARKQPDLLLKAVKRMHNTHKNIVVVFVGSGELKAPLEALAHTQPKVQIRLVGFKNQTELSRYYLAADLSVFPSCSETWGLVVNEALHHGLPCVVSEAVGCAPDLIEPHVTGEIFKTESVEELSLAIQRAFGLINNPDIREKCRRKVSKYTVGNAARGIAEAYWAVTSK